MFSEAKCSLDVRGAVASARAASGAVIWRVHYGGRHRAAALPAVRHRRGLGAHIAGAGERHDDPLRGIRLLWLLASQPHATRGAYARRLYSNSRLL